ncbi:MAG: ATP synthase F1 subunit gamma [Salinivirgaceae bacterium]|nr:ATP synthase F1 subunit gamma [Salinivirgaceae bacterium]
MANLKEIRTRILSVTNTRQVTSAMKMVSAAKLRKAQDAIFKIKPYSEKMQQIIETVSGSLEGTLSTPLFTQREIKKTLIILVTSNKGLCGVFNTSITRSAIEWAKSERAELFKNNNIEFFTVGRKGYESIIKSEMNSAGREDNLLHKPSYDFSAFFIKHLIGEYTEKRFDEIVVFYNSFKNAATQIPTMEKLLPISMPEHSAKEPIEFILEPNPEVILEELAPKMLEVRFHKVILDSIASEHGARMTAMHKATDNATDLINDLKLTYNRARQDSITKEILEIVSGANALQG